MQKLFLVNLLFKFLYLLFSFACFFIKLTHRKTESCFKNSYYNILLKFRSPENIFIQQACK